MTRTNLGPILTAFALDSMWQEVDVGNSLWTMLIVYCVINNFVFRYAAKSCDEIGRLAAVLAVTGDWDEETDIDRDTMKIRWK